MGSGKGGGQFTNTSGGKTPKFPGNDPAKPPGEGFEWRERGTVGSIEGSWFNPSTNEQWRSDLSHPDPVGLHWEHDHCESCTDMINVETGKAYCTTDQYHWICPACFDDFKEMFEWKLLPTKETV